MSIAQRYVPAGGLMVAFPYEPYSQQEAMMSAIVAAVENGENLLLESPTGTGKSLVLICSTLAWQRSQHDHGDESASPLPSNSRNNKSTQTTEPGMTADADETASTDEPERHPRFDDGSEGSSLSARYFDYTGPPSHAVSDLDGYTSSADSRHGSDVLGEEYERPGTVDRACDSTQSEVPKVYFVTRTHKQIEQLVRELKKTVYRNVRMTILSSRKRTCINKDVSSAADVRDACSKAVAAERCHFYSNLQNISEETMRQKLRELRVQDPTSECQAWDIEDLKSVASDPGCEFCPYWASLRTLKRDADLIFCPYEYIIDPAMRRNLRIDISNSVIVMDEGHNVEEVSRSALSYEFKMNQLQAAVEEFGRQNAWQGSLKELHDIADGIQQFILRRQPSTQPSRVGADEISSLMKTVGTENLEDLRRCRDAIWVLFWDRRGRPAVSYESLNVVGNWLDLAEHMQLGHRTVQAAMDHYATFVRLNIQTGGAELKFICLDGSQAFGKLTEEARSIIIASGTLSPMEMLKTELAASFREMPVPHVIQRDRFHCVAIATVGLPLTVTSHCAIRYAL